MGEGEKGKGEGRTSDESEADVGGDTREDLNVPVIELIHLRLCISNCISVNRRGGGGRGRKREQERARERKR